GIYFEGITEETARMYGIKPGLYIKQIDPSCDIANSGLQVYDIITEINGKEVYDYESAMAAIEGFKAGDEITAKVYRKSIVGDETEFEIKFKLMEDTSGN
ncbi:MAG: S1C family serine protease, partial [Oscillospiraceae bacterium]|nr:S1C family serine protease [Oscillospiraceae bacterium]